MYFLLHYSLSLIRCIVFIALAKIPEREGSIQLLWAITIFISHKYQPYLHSRWVPVFVPAVHFPQTSQQRVAWRYLVFGVFADDEANGGWFLLGFHAILDAGCRFWEHLHSLREVKGLQDCSKTFEMGI